MSNTDHPQSRYIRIKPTKKWGWGIDEPVFVEGNTAYAVHAADGTEIAVMANRDIAFAAIRQNDLRPVSVH